MENLLLILINFIPTLTSLPWSPNETSSIVEKRPSLQLNINSLRILNESSTKPLKIERRNSKKFKPITTRKTTTEPTKTPETTPYYIPYWATGDHIFYWSSKMPLTLPSYQEHKVKNVTNQYERDYKTFGTKPGMQYHDCDRDCTDIMLRYQMLCAVMIKSDKNEYVYKEFNNYCELELYNCKFYNARPGYLIIHRGQCRELTTFHRIDLTPDNNIKYKRSWLKLLKELNTTAYTTTKQKKYRLK